MKKLTSYGTVNAGVLRISHRSKFDAALKTMSDGRVLVTIEKLYNKRTLNQNAYYWGVVLELYFQALRSEGWEITKAETHEDLIQRFSKKSVQNTCTGEIKDVPLRSADMTKVEFMEYIDRIIKSAAEDLQTVIPQPNEQLTIENLPL